MATVSELIHSSFRLIGAIAAGETLETNELNDAFVSLNQMLLNWNNSGAMMAGRVHQYVNLNANINWYQLPAGQRPMKIEAASVSIAGIDCPLEIVDAPGWEAITEKGQLAIIIKKLYCDYLFPVASVFLWPTPRTAGNLELWQYSYFPMFTDVNQTISIVDGYEQAIRYNFAVALLPEYPRSQVDPSLIPQAQAYKAAIEQLNVSNLMKTQQPAATAVAAQGAS